MSRYKKLTLLHSNDMHGDFTALDVDTNLVGGVSMLSGYVDKVRREETNTLYCIAGDMFRGSVIDSEYKGLSTIDIMNAIEPDVVTLGNHETDYVLHIFCSLKNAQSSLSSMQTCLSNPTIPVCSSRRLYWKLAV